MNLKLRFLHSHIHQFHKVTEDYSKEQGKYFQEYIMKGMSCGILWPTWTLGREDRQREIKRKRHLSTFFFKCEYTKKKINEILLKWTTNKES